MTPEFSFTYEGKNRIYVGMEARLIENEREIASEWASKHILLNPAHAWVLGKFVESDRANKNQQYFALGDLKTATPTIAHAPMNINHNARNIVGAYVASEVIYPTGEESAEQLNPYIESLAVVWKYYFPDEYRAIQKAAGTGGLYYSMECVPQAVSTVGGEDDSKTYPYQGRQSPTYPRELNERSVPMKLHAPHFVGGALVLAPEKPAWNKADVQQVSSFMNDSWKQAEMAYEEYEETDAEVWESLMSDLIADADACGSEFDAEEAADKIKKKAKDKKKDKLLPPWLKK